MAHNLKNTSFFSTQEQIQGIPHAEGHAITTIPNTHGAFEDVLLDTTLTELELLPWDQVPMFQSIARSYDVPTTNAKLNHGHEGTGFQNGKEGAIQSNEQPSSTKSQKKTKIKSPSVYHEERCKKRGPFFNRYTLKRHIQSQHRARGAFKCPHECKRVFNRKDNLDQHLRAVH
ncbi:unnamed protein product [Penicillium pancosmium]